ncbi:DUF3667 domain-containing protein [Chitinophaga agrisoli]|uniref:DUF3667 domain-containing protein n=1 Tax=Chitinophaga agrisoli TaxID=2607653 RepID=A0A5B2VQP0_9BACT|nr:DUF3667 domain-containing protein [Chitinophaga agrisoli]KAA2240696.1 DUF3667 domain-containing protein [Chitinophaga agrisoli]
MRPHVINKPHYCPTCLHKFSGGYCYNCGEKSVDLNEHGVKKYLTDALDAFTHFDGKFFKTIKYLMLYPGKLTVEYFAGRRVKLMKPLQLYLVITLLYFIFQKSFDFFYNHLEYVVTQHDQLSLQAKELALGKAVAKGLSFETFTHTFNHAAQDNAKVFIFILIPVLGLLLYILFYQRYRKYVPHLIFATHYFTFYLISWALYTRLIAEPLIHNRQGWLYEHREWLWGFIILMNTLYLVLALRRVYANNWGWTIIKGLIISQLMIYIGTVYKLFITFFTLWTI